MTNLDTEKDKELVEKKNNLKVLTGGKPPGNPDWLSSLAPGTVFLCCLREELVQPDKKILEWHVAYKSRDGHVKLLTNNNQEYWMWVNPVHWCQNKELLEVLGVFPIVPKNI